MVAVDSGRTSWFPSGIVLLTVPPTAAVPAQRSPGEPAAAQQGSGPDPASGRGWAVVDATGEQVAVWPTHRQAMADLGRIALRGAHLPLLVHGPDGRATGDRLG